MTLGIREAAEADLPQVLSLYAQRDMDDGSVLSIDGARQILRRFAAYPDYCLFVAVDENAGQKAATRRHCRPT